MCFFEKDGKAMSFQIRPFGWDVTFSDTQKKAFWTHPISEHNTPKKTLYYSPDSDRSVGRTSTMRRHFQHPGNGPKMATWLSCYCVFSLSSRRVSCSTHPWKSSFLTLGAHTPLISRGWNMVKQKNQCIKTKICFGSANFPHSSFQGDVL